jgi:hypothetical protein
VVYHFSASEIRRLLKENPTYSQAVYQRRDPKEWLAQKEAELNEASPIAHALLAYAALEAGAI